MTATQSVKTGVESERSSALANRQRSFRHDCQAMGARLRSTRQERGLTLGDVARGLGVTTACVCQWEAGKSYPKPHFWPELARIVGTTVSYLLAGENEAGRDRCAFPDQVVERARGEIAKALGLEMSKVRIEVDR